MVKLVEGQRYGLLLEGPLGPSQRAALEAIGACDLLVLTFDCGKVSREAVESCQQVASRVGVVITSVQEAKDATEAGADVLLAKGHEAGGVVGEETSFILLQHLRAANCRLPIFAWGGIGFHTAAACRVAGSSGVVLDWQLSLTQESPLPAGVRKQLEHGGVPRTSTLPAPGEHFLRCLAQATSETKKTLSASLKSDKSTSLADWSAEVSRLLGLRDENERLHLMGQDAAFAVAWRDEAPSVARALKLLGDRTQAAVEAAMQSRMLAEESPLATSHGTRYPVVQAPIMRVSDVPEFGLEVAENGGLPFLSLGRRTGDQARKLLQEASKLLTSQSWGVSLLGDGNPRAEHIAAVEEVRPPYAMVDAELPEQATALEARGVATYLRIDSPQLLAELVEKGVRRFVFEGSECGGRVGPLTSFVLWERMIQTLVDANLPLEQASQLHVLFAGGIHDGLSSAMVAAMAQPLVDRGANVGVLLGTAYLFTKEIVSTGAVVPGFQDEAIRAKQTVLLETGRDRARRAAKTNFFQTFLSEKARLKQEQVSAEQIQEELEHLMMGRLRIASKGKAHRGKPAAGESPFVKVTRKEQRRDGLYPLGQSAALRSKKCSLRELHEEVCHGGLEHLRSLETTTRVRVVDACPAPPPLDIAIIGMSCLLPGADNLTSYWDNILQKRDLVQEVPVDRFDVSRWFDRDRGARDRIYSKWGGFLDDTEFDPLKYGIPPMALKSIEPMQLLALELVDRSLRDAGYREDNPHKERTSVILGAGGGIAELGAGYALRSALPGLFEDVDERILGQLPEWTEDSFAGILLNVVAGRISNRFDLGGVNFTVDAACASSLGALYLACRELADHTSDMVITGGCDTLQSPFTYLCFAKAGALSPRGRSRTFDVNSDGIAISEGLASVVLKRREDAERDGDRIYALIRAAAGGSDGRSKGMATPRLEGQMRTIERAYAQARFSPTTVGLFEAHGTGTSVGDQTECQSLTNVLNKHGARPHSQAVGSVKSMIGHTKCTAGVASLIKSALALHHRVLPPTMHVDQPNPKAGLVDGPLYVNSEVRPWIRGPQPRRLGVSSFGFGGTNFHAVLEEYEGHALPTRDLTPHCQREAELFVFTGETLEGLATEVRSLLDPVRNAIDAQRAPAMPDLAFAWHRQQPIAQQAIRATVVAATPRELVEQLNALIAQLQSGTGELDPRRLPTGVHCTAKPLGHDRPLAFLFPGQGSQYPNMLRSLAVEFSEISRRFDLLDTELADAFDQPLSNYVFPPPEFSDEERKRSAENLKPTDLLQPILGASDTGMLRLLESFGLHPNMVAGHSYGELVALHAAGSLDEASLYRLSLARGRAISEMTNGNTGDLGSMLAVRAGEEEVRLAIAECEEAWLANMNSPRQTIIAGSMRGIEDAAKRLNAAQLAYTPIAVACGFHSPLMAPARKQLESALKQFDLRPPRIDVYSNTTAKPYPKGPAEIREQLSEHLVRQVRFAAQIDAMHNSGAPVFIEVGPGRVLSKLVRDVLGDRPHLAVATQTGVDGGLRQFLDALGELISHGVAVKLDRLYQGRPLTDLKLDALSAPAEKPSPHTWLINGSYVRPATEPKRSPKKRVELLPEGAQLAVPDSEAKAIPSSAALPAATAPAASQPPASHLVTSNGESPATKPVAAMEATDQRPTQPPANRPAASLDDFALAEFQQTMREFLKSQETVLTAFFGGNPPPTNQDAMPAQAAIPAAVFPTTASPTTTAESTELPPAVPVVEASETPTPAADIAAPRISTDAFRDTLLEVVSERTGYPADMLQLDANLEADLGIDSIKRVEIIGAFRRAALPEMDEPPAWFMEQMSGAGTLDQILGGITQLAAENGASPASTAPEIQPTGPSSQELQHMLLEVVSERTGYPADMLQLDANLEADLGIDSIKRVEIIGAFRRAALPEMDEPPAWFMERMAEANSLDQILGGVNELAGQSGPLAATPPADPVPTTTEAQGPTSEDLQRMLLDVVSERTGYPADMLQLEANLEADLGIDSIKRVEIIGAFRREALPEMDEPPAWFMEQMSGAGTLEQILKGMEELHASEGAPAPTIEPTETISATHQDLEQLLLDVVSERTGYPGDMLDIDANLEADLGIDSIKRVEIIGAFRRAAVPSDNDPPAWFMEQMSEAANMRNILDGVKRLAEPSGETQSSPKPVSSSNGNTNGNGFSKPEPHTDESCPRCVIATVEVPTESSETLTSPPGVHVLTDDGHGIAAGVATQIEAQGHRTCILPAAALASREAAEAAITEVRREYGTVGAILHLLPLREAQAFPGIDDAAWNEHAATEVRGMMFLMQAVARELSAAAGGDMLIASVTQGGGDFDAEGNDEAIHPWRGGLAGMMKTAAKEWEGARFRNVDFAEKPSASQVLDELLTTGPVEVGYRDGCRLTKVPVRGELPENALNSPAVKLDRNSVVLLTGGARGITAQVACEIARQTQARLILMGRSGVPSAETCDWARGIADQAMLRTELIARMRDAGEKFTPRDVESRLSRLMADCEILDNLETIERAGSAVEYVSCDLRDEIALTSIVRDLQSRFDRIDALIHGAGVIEDRFIVDKTTESYDRVVGTKLDGLLTLLRLVDPDQLRMLALFSSVSGFFGNPGQVDYAAANEMLNRIASRLSRQWSGKVVALNWGPWQGAGMVTPEVARQFETRGVPMVSVPAGCHAVMQEMLHEPHSASCVLYGGGPWIEEADTRASESVAFHVDTPLLTGQHVFRTPEGAVEAQVVLDPSRQRYLNDHQIDDKPVLPAAFVMELMVETAQAAAPVAWHVTKVENFRSFSGVIIEKDKRTIALRAEPVAQDNDTGSWRVRLFDPQMPARMLYEGLVHLARLAPQPPEAPELSQITGTFPLDSVDEAYQRWLFHGPTLQAITRLDGLDNTGIDAVFSPSSARECIGPHADGDWLIDPVVLDAAPQLGMIWSRAVFDTSPLPNRVAAYHRFAPVGDEPLVCLFRVDPESNESWYKADVWLLRKGKVVGLLEGLEGAGSAALNRIARSSTQ